MLSGAGISAESGVPTFRDDKKGGHGLVDMYKSIVESCDTYYYQLGNEMGKIGRAHV